MTDKDWEDLNLRLQKMQEEIESKTDQTEFRNEIADIRAMLGNLDTDANSNLLGNGASGAGKSGK
jgi:hypothetical protein